MFSIWTYGCARLPEPPSRFPSPPASQTQLVPLQEVNQLCMYARMQSVIFSESDEERKKIKRKMDILFWVEDGSKCDVPGQEGERLGLGPSL